MVLSAVLMVATVNIARRMMSSSGAFSLAALAGVVGQADHQALTAAIVASVAVVNQASGSVRRLTAAILATLTAHSRRPGGGGYCRRRCQPEKLIVRR